MKNRPDGSGMVKRRPVGADPCVCPKQSHHKNGQREHASRRSIPPFSPKKRK